MNGAKPHGKSELRIIHVYPMNERRGDERPSDREKAGKVEIACAQMEGKKRKEGLKRPE